MSACYCTWAQLRPFKSLMDLFCVPVNVQDKVLDLLIGREPELPQKTRERTTMARQAVAERLGCAAGTVDRLAREGKLVRVGKAYTVESVEKFATLKGV